MTQPSLEEIERAIDLLVREGRAIRIVVDGQPGLKLLDPRREFAAKRVKRLSNRIRLLEAALRTTGDTPVTNMKGGTVSGRIRLDKLARERWLKEFPDLET